MKFLKTANVLAVGDLHFKTDNIIQTNEFSKRIFGYISEHGKNLKAVAILGDILHRHDKIDLEPMKRAIDFLKTIRTIMNEKSHLFIIIGNHDIPNNNSFQTDTHAFNALKLWKNTTVGDRTISVELPGNLKFLLVPYVFPGRFFEATKDFNLKDFTAVFAHQEFRGSIRSADDLEPGASGSKIGDVYPSSKNAGVCVSGHIHFYDDKHVENVIYTGTPFTHSWVKYEDIDKNIHSPVLLNFVETSCDEEKWSLKTTDRLFELSAGIPKNITIDECSTTTIPTEIIEELTKRGDVNKIKVNIKCDSSVDLVTISKGTAEINRLRSLGVIFTPQLTSSAPLPINLNNSSKPAPTPKINFIQRVLAHEKIKDLNEKGVSFLKSISV